jgi:hypothetical protein
MTLNIKLYLLLTIPGTDGMKYDWYEMDLILTSAV